MSANIFTMEVLKNVGANLSGLDSEGDPCILPPFLTYAKDAVCNRTDVVDPTLHQFFCGPFEGWSPIPVSVGDTVTGWYPTTNIKNWQGAMYFDSRIITKS